MPPTPTPAAPTTGKADVAEVVRSAVPITPVAAVGMSTGAVMGPFECFLASRGLKTLDLRVREQSRTALKLAEWLQQDPRVARVLYPGLPDHPGHDLAAKQMVGGFGAMFDDLLAGGYAFLALQALVLLDARFGVLSG